MLLMLTTNFNPLFSLFSFFLTQLEKLISKNYYLHQSARDGYRSYLQAYGSYSLKRIFDIHSLDLIKVSRAFGFKVPPKVNLGVGVSLKGSNVQGGKRGREIDADEIETAGTSVEEEEVLIQGDRKAEEASNPKLNGDKTVDGEDEEDVDERSKRPRTDRSRGGGRGGFGDRGGRGKGGRGGGRGGSNGRGGRGGRGAKQWSG